ncbi:MAG: DUF5668 domain-containing protein [Patescibacteria group bacterium]|nr:DUF5668 domain-containing protein [Patescibacteria group bacterium]
MENKYGQQTEELKDKVEKVEEVKKEEKREEKKEESKEDNKNNPRRNHEKIGFKSFFGLIIILLGLFYLGRNMGWWNFYFDQAIFWPLVLMMIGLLIIGNHLILRWLLVMISIFVAVVLISSLFFYAKDSRKIEKGPINQVENSVYQTSVYQSSRGDYNTYFFGDLNRSEVEQKINSILDYIYRSNPGDKEYVEVKIDKK